MVIQHNMLAMCADYALGKSSKSLRKSTEKLSSGYKINRAGDDAARLAISEKMRGQIRGLNRATENIEDGISLVQVADGALNETHEILQRINELVIQAANDTNTQEDREAIQVEIVELIADINRIADDTSFNGDIFPLKDTTKMINGVVNSDTTLGPILTPVAPVVPALTEADYAGGSVQLIDSNNITNYTSYIDGEGKTHYQLGEGTFQITGISNVVLDIAGTTFLQDTNLKNVTINCANGTKLSVKNVTIDNSENIGYDVNSSKTEIGAALKFSGKDNQLNCFGENSFCAGADNYSSYIDKYSGAKYFENMSGIEIMNSAQLEINGTDSSKLIVKGNMTDTQTGGNACNSSASGIGGNGDLIINSGYIIADTNQGSGISVGTIWVNGGVIEATGGKEDSYVFSAETYMEINGGTVNAVGYGFLGCAPINIGNAGIININGGSVYSHQIEDFAFGGPAIGSNEKAIININGGNVVAISESPFGAAIGVSGSEGQVKINGGKVTAISKDTMDAIGYGSWKKEDIIFFVEGNLADPTGENDGQGHNVYSYPEATENGNGVNGENGSNNGLKTKNKGLWIQTGADAGQGFKISLVNATASFIGVQNIDATTFSGAQSAIELVQKAINRVSEYRGLFGAYQNRLEHAKVINDNSVENTQYAESKLRDTDMAEEMTRFSKGNILAQVGQAILTQANQSKQGILSLLK